MDNGRDIEVLGQVEMEATLSPQRDLLALASSADNDRLQSLVGVNVTGKFRSKLREMFPASEARESGNYLLFDDIPGAVFVSNWAWLCWDGRARARRPGMQDSIADPAKSMAGVCIGLAEGSSALDRNGFPDLAQQSSAIVPDIVDPDDEVGWHRLPPPPQGPGSRRSRWLDLSREGADIMVSTGFQDSAVEQSGLRRAVHEYRAAARIDRDGVIVDIAATPHVLPYSTCPAAVGNIHGLIGLRVADLRETVPVMLGREAGCTHLNDVLRALASISSLIPHVD